jgi:hypothetical protein
MVRFIGENADTLALQTQTYSLALSTGTPLAQVYTKPTFTQSGASRWTKVFWIGGAPSAISIDHNISYIEATTFVPNYDTSVAITGSAVNNYCNNWKNANTDIGGAGNWTKNMPVTGSRPDIGPYPDWTVLWLYTGNSCLEAAARGNADLAASWTVHIREGAPGKIMLRTDPPGSSTALGHVVSVSGRPTVSGTGNFNTSAADQIHTVGAMGTQGWNDDMAHEPEVASLVYTLTGDFWYLEEAWFWASYDTAGELNYPPYQRFGALGMLNHSQIRAMAWQLRNRVNTAFVSPDGTLEQNYFNTLVDDALACEEGARNITTTAYNGSTAWNLCRNQFATSDSEAGFPGFKQVKPGTVTPLHQWAGGGADFAQDEYGVCSSTGGIQPSPCTTPTVLAATSFFESDYLLYSLGRAKELGYRSGALLSWLGSLYTGMLTDPNFNPFLIDNGRVPTIKLDGSYFSTYADLKTGYGPTWINRTSLGSGNDPDGYAAYAIAGISYLGQEPNGPAAWNFMRGHYNWSVFMNLPKWAIAPRGGAGIVTSSCDLNQDGTVDALDVQLSIGQALGQSPCTGDLAGTGTCNVVDTQRVINAALGGSCRLGP